MGKMDLFRKKSSLEKSNLGALLEEFEEEKTTQSEEKKPAKSKKPARPVVEFNNGGEFIKTLEDMGYVFNSGSAPEMLVALRTVVKVKPDELTRRSFTITGAAWFKLYELSAMTNLSKSKLVEIGIWTLALLYEKPEFRELFNQLGEKYPGEARVSEKELVRTITDGLKSVLEELE